MNDMRNNRKASVGGLQKKKHTVLAKCCQQIPFLIATNTLRWREIIYHVISVRRQTDGTTSCGFSSLDQIKFSSSLSVLKVLMLNIKILFYFILFWFHIFKKTCVAIVTIFFPNNIHLDIQGVSGGIVNILGGGSMDYSE